MTAMHVNSLTKRGMSALDCHKLLFDTNALVDFSCPTYERPRHDAVATLVTQAFVHSITTYVSMGSLKDTYYLLRRMGRNHIEAQRAVGRLLMVFTPLDLCSHHARSALVSDEPDFEDGLIRAQAEELGVDAIVTDDRHAFATCEIPHLSAADCLKVFWPDAA